MVIGVVGTTGWCGGTNAGLNVYFVPFVVLPLLLGCTTHSPLCFVLVILVPLKMRQNLVQHPLDGW